MVVVSLFRCFLALYLATQVIVEADKRRQFLGFKDSVRTRRETCGKGQYYDPVTDHCDVCGPHCDRPSQPPPAPCQQFCRDRGTYRAKTRSEDTPKPTCDKGLYHDDVTGHCDPCGPHCDRILWEEPPAACRNYCRDSEKSHDQRPIPGSETNSHISAGTVAAIVLSTGFAIVAAVGLVLLIRHVRQPRQQNIHLGNPEKEPMKHPVFEDTNETERTEMVPNPSNV